MIRSDSSPLLGLLGDGKRFRFAEKQLKDPKITKIFKKCFRPSVASQFSANFLSQFSASFPANFPLLQLRINSIDGFLKKNSFLML